MKRDLDRIRDILIECENSDEQWFTIGTREETDWGEELKTKHDSLQLAHYDLMVDAGFIERENVAHPGLAGPEIAEVMYKVTWSGHDYLDAVRDQKIWDRTKKALIETGGSATLEIVKSLALGFLKKKIETHTGVQL